MTLDGRGFGHGVGLSQWGAFGLAVYSAQTWQQILAHYYSATSLSPGTGADSAPLPNGTVSVRLQGVDGAQTAVTQSRGLARFDGDPVGGRSWGSIVARQVPGQVNRYDVWAQAASACAGTGSLGAGWTSLGASVTGPVTFSSPNGSVASAVIPDDVLGVCEPAGDVRYYRGTIQAVRDPNGEARSVNVVPMELYVRAVVSQEMSGSWGAAGGGAGINALRAQAVASRSYALTETSSANPGLRYAYAKTCDRSCQAYGGAAVRRGGLTATLSSLESASATAATETTAGIVLRTSDGKVSRTYFSASNGGRTAVGPFVVVDDPADGTPENPNFTWHVVLTSAKIEAAWPQLGTLTGAAAATRDGSGGEWGGRVTTVRLTGTATTITITADTFRTAVGIKSTWFAFV